MDIFQVEEEIFAIITGRNFSSHASFERSAFFGEEVENRRESRMRCPLV